MNSSRIAILSRYNLADTYVVTAEFKSMLENLTARSQVLFLSMKGTKTLASPDNVTIDHLPSKYDRGSARDVQKKAVFAYFLIPVVAWKIHKFKPRLIFLVDAMPLYGFLLKIMCRTKVATMYGDWTFHNMFGRKRWAKIFLKIFEALDRFETRRLDGFFCRSRAAGDKVIERGVHSDLIRVVRDAPDTNAFSPRDESKLRKRCGFDDKDVVLLFHGVMHQGKGLDMLLKWTADLYKEHPCVGIILVGGGPEEQALRNFAKSLGLQSRAVFTGWLETLKEVGRYCNATDICVVMRTKDEANKHIIPGALIHGMACRKIVVAPRLPGISELIHHGQNGYMFEPDNGEDFKKLIRQLIERRADWERVRSQAFRESADNFSVDALGKQYAEALEHFAGL